MFTQTLLLCFRTPTYTFSQITPFDSFTFQTLLSLEQCSFTAAHLSTEEKKVKRCSDYICSFPKEAIQKKVCWETDLKKIRIQLPGQRFNTSQVCTSKLARKEGFTHIPMLSGGPSRQVTIGLCQAINGFNEPCAVSSVGLVLCEISLQISLNVIILQHADFCLHYEPDEAHSARRAMRSTILRSTPQPFILSLSSAPSTHGLISGRYITPIGCQIIKTP